MSYSSQAYLAEKEVQENFKREEAEYETNETFGFVDGIGITLLKP